MGRGRNGGLTEESHVTNALRDVERVCSGPVNNKTVDKNAGV